MLLRLHLLTVVRPLFHLLRPPILSLLRHVTSPKPFLDIPRLKLDLFPLPASTSTFPYHIPRIGYVPQIGACGVVGVHRPDVLNRPERPALPSYLQEPRALDPLRERVPLDGHEVVSGNLVDVH